MFELSFALPFLLWSYVLYISKPSPSLWLAMLATIPVTLLVSWWNIDGSHMTYHMPALFIAVGGYVVLTRGVSPAVASAMTFFSLFVPDVIACISKTSELGMPAWSWMRAVGGGGWVDSLVIVPVMSFAVFVFCSRMAKLQRSIQATAQAEA